MFTNISYLPRRSTCSLSQILAIFLEHLCRKLYYIKDIKRKVCSTIFFWPPLIVSFRVAGLATTQGAPKPFWGYRSNTQSLNNIAVCFLRIDVFYYHHVLGNSRILSTFWFISIRKRKKRRRKRKLWSNKLLYTVRSVTYNFSFNISIYFCC